MSEHLNGGEQEDRLVGTSEQLLAHLQERVATEGDELGTSDYRLTVDLATLLADRIKGGVVPMGFVMATELLAYDCNKGVSGFGGEPMPASVLNYPPVMYRMFSVYQATQLARGAFGDEFADQVEAFRAEVSADVAAQTPPSL